MQKITIHLCPRQSRAVFNNMADSAVRLLLLSTTVWTLLQTPEIQAQNTISTISTSPSSVPPPSILATSAFSSNSTIAGLEASVASQPSSVSTNVSSTHAIQSDTVTLQGTPSDTIAPTTTLQQQLIISTPVSPSQSVTSSPSQSGTSSPPTTESESGKDDKESFTITEYILTACLGVFVFVLIAIIYLVVQIKRLNKSVHNLNATSNG